MKDIETSVYDQRALQKIADLLIKNKSTLSVAESVTSGSIQMAISLANGATAFFQGGLTAYQGEQKTRILGVEPIHGKDNEFVNYQVACEMAIGSNKFFLSNYAIAITGFAQPIPGHEFKHPYAYYAIAKEDKVLTKGFLESQFDDPWSVQTDFTNQVLVAFRDLIDT